MTPRLAYPAVLVAAIVPRGFVLAAERGAILEENVEKSDRFAQTLVESGTFGFLPGRPSAYTQPLYGWFLAGLYEALERHWLVVGVAQIAIAALTALLVLEIGRRIASLAVGTVGAALATVHPFLVWHDVHVNREILDQLLAAAIALLALLVAQRRGALLALVLGACLGLAILGNARLALLPALLACFVALPARGSLGRSLLLATAVLVAAALVVSPWLVRNELRLGCPALTTDARALWKANNPSTRAVLARGGWIDDVPELPGAPPWPELAADLTLAGQPTEVDECAQARFYREQVLAFWREEPREKALLALQAARMLWSPVFTVEAGERGGLAGLVRAVVEPLFMACVYAAALAGALLVPRRCLALVVLLLGYNTAAAMLFAGTVRYRAPFDFLLALLAGAALVRVTEAFAGRRRRRAALASG